MPFGQQNAVNYNSKKDRLSFIGKENDAESGLGDFGVRKFDGTRFLSIDPLWEKYYAWTPYHYCGNNPVNATDANGKNIDYSVNGTNVFTIYTDKFTSSYNYENKNFVLSKDFKAGSIKLSEHASEIWAYNTVALGIQVGGEFTFGAGMQASITLLDFRKGKDKDNGIFAYFTVGATIGFNIGLGAEFLICKTDMNPDNISAVDAKGKYWSLGAGCGPAGVSASYSLDEPGIGGFFSETHKFYQYGVGGGPTKFKYGGSVASGETFAPWHITNFDIFH